MAILRTRFNAGNYLPVIPNEDMVGGRLVKLAAGGDGAHGRPRVEYTDDANDLVYGALEYDGKAQDEQVPSAPGRNVSVNRRGTLMLLEAHAALTENQRLVPAALGRVAPFPGTPAGDENVIGQALHAAAAQGDKVWCVVDFKIV